CSRRCTFCVLRRDVVGGMRILDMERPLSQIPAHARRVGLVGAAVTDHPQLLPLVAAIVESGREIGISSLRADRLTPELCRLLRESGHRTLTVASDGISERMRSLLHRKIHAPSLVHAAELARAHGYHRLKVYQMIGAPAETEDDVDELIRFALELAKIHRLTLTFSTFVAKRNTPLDGQPFVGVKEAERRLKKIRAGLRGRVELRPQSPRWAHVEYLLAQRGADSGHAAIRAVHAGARYADWVRAFEETPAVARPLRFGDEEAWARRKGKAARRPALPIVHDAAPRSPE
ncbi:MAG: radical SAM protein, partial [Myxococcales bacterium]|nr:radical SAM protein [Myxococcales bacterium]